MSDVQAPAAGRVAGLDSSTARPTLEQARAARAAGVRVWGGYLPPGVGLQSPWDRASFQTVQRAGLVAIGYASGNDDPVQVAATARAWGVLGCLDDEDGIRAVGGWEQQWLDASGFGIYGNSPVHGGVRARFHVLAAYPGFDPAATWSPALPRPAGPVGWQWQGDHIDPVTGLEVDSSWFDPWFLTAAGGDVQTLTSARPDGGTDVYVLEPGGGQIHHVVRDFLGQIVFRDEPPGLWAALSWAGYRGTGPVLQGWGTDWNPYEITAGAGGWSGPVAKP